MAIRWKIGSWHPAQVTPGHQKWQGYHRIVCGLAWPADWVGLGWVGNGSKICVFSGLGWVMGLKWQMCEIRALLFLCWPHHYWHQIETVSRESWISWTYSLGVACMTVMLVILWVFALLRCALGWWWWWHDVHKLIFLRQASCCSMYGGSVGYGLGWVMGP